MVQVCYECRVHDFTKLDLWRVARQLASDCYLMTRSMPPDERFGLTAQIRRSSVSIASNIAEGAGRATAADFRRFARVAAGSACELETQILIAVDVGALRADEAAGALVKTTRVKKMLTALEKRLTLEAANSARSHA